MSEKETHVSENPAEYPGHGSGPDAAPDARSVPDGGSPAAAPAGPVPVDTERVQPLDATPAQPEPAAMWSAAGQTAPVPGQGDHPGGEAAPPFAPEGAWRYPDQPLPVGAGQPYRPDGPGAAPRGRGRLGRGLVLGLLAVLLAGGGGVAGGLIVHQVDKREPAATSSAGTSAATVAAPTIDRSSLAAIVARVQPAVVSIKTGSAEGSGVVLTADGYILTNNHVVAAGQGGSVSVGFTDGKTASATTVGTDPKSDLAVVKAKGMSGLTTAKLGDSTAMRVGDSVFAIGSPLGLEGSVTAGIISATDRTIQEGDAQQNPFGGAAANTISGLLQTDAAINPGNSGGALVNLNGEVIGINTAIATAGQGSEGNIGVGFAIPSNRARQVTDQLIKGQKVSHPYLGVAVTDAANNGGALVSRVASGGPADKAGIRTGDVIVNAGGKAVHSADDLVGAVQSHAVGDRVDIVLVRGGSQNTVTVTIGES